MEFIRTKLKSKPIKDEHIFEAVQNGKEKKVKTWLSKSKKENYKDNQGRTLLYHACSRSQLQIVKTLVKNYADSNIGDETQITPLHMAAGQGNKKIMDILIKNGASVNYKDVFGRTPLWKILYSSEKIDCVEFLIEKGAHVNVHDNELDTPLHTATESGHQKIVKHLLKKGADANARNKANSTPLHVASKKGDHDTVCSLLDCFANANQKDSDQRSPLFLASEAGHTAIVETLLGKYSEIVIDEQDKDGATPLYVACKQGNHNVVKLLLCWRADANLATIKNETPLFIACQKCDLSMVRLLLEKGARIDGHESPLHIACKNKHVKIVAVLLEHCADDVNSVDSAGMTPLHYAAEATDVNLVEELLKYNPKLAQNKIGKSPLDIANFSGCQWIQDELQSYIDRNPSCLEYRHSISYTERPDSGNRFAPLCQIEGMDNPSEENQDHELDTSAGTALTSNQACHDSHECPDTDVKQRIQSFSNVYATGGNSAENLSRIDGMENQDPELVVSAAVKSNQSRSLENFNTDVEQQHSLRSRRSFNYSSVENMSRNEVSDEKDVFINPTFKDCANAQFNPEINASNVELKPEFKNSDNAKVNPTLRYAYNVSLNPVFIRSNNAEFCPTVINSSSVELKPKFIKSYSPKVNPKIIKTRDRMEERYQFGGPGVVDGNEAQNPGLRSTAMMDTSTDVTDKYKGSGESELRGFPRTDKLNNSTSSGASTADLKAKYEADTFISSVRKNFQDLVHLLKVTDHLDYLFQESAISLEEREVIDSKPGTVQKTRELLMTLLRKRSTHWVHVFYESLQNDDNHVLSMLQNKHMS